MSEVLEVIENRKSIRAFSDKAVEPEKLEAVFKAAQLAASCFNEQPWRFVYATKSQPEAREKLFECINEFNQSWANSADVLMVSIAKTSFSMNGNPNRHAWHDTGAAVAQLSLQATELGLYVHQMAGFFPEKARELLQIPEGFEPVAAIALGYPGQVDSLPANLQEKEKAPRTRKDLNELVFSGSFGNTGLSVSS